MIILQHQTFNYYLDFKKEFGKNAENMKKKVFEPNFNFFQDQLLEFGCFGVFETHF